LLSATERFTVIESFSAKTKDDRLVLFAATEAQSKLSNVCRLLSRIFPRIDLHMENERSTLLSSQSLRREQICQFYFGQRNAATKFSNVAQYNIIPAT